MGEDELASGKGILRDMENKGQKEITLEDVVNKLVKALETDE